MLIVTYIPKKRNNGRLVGRREFDRMLEELLAITGGCSVSGPVRGIWVGAKRIYDEENYRVEAACDAGSVQAVRDWVQSVGRRLGQEAMYFEVRDGAAEIIPIEN